MSKIKEGEYFRLQVKATGGWVTRNPEDHRLRVMVTSDDAPPHDADVMEWETAEAGAKYLSYRWGVEVVPVRAGMFVLMMDAAGQRHDGLFLETELVKAGIGVKHHLTQRLSRANTYVTPQAAKEDRARVDRWIGRLAVCEVMGGGEYKFVE